MLNVYKFQTTRNNLEVKHHVTIANKYMEKSLK